MSVARRGADAHTLSEISESLSSNDLVREDEKYSPTRLRPEALTDLYTTLTSTERQYKAHGVPTLNGHGPENGSNPRKRKLSSPSPTPSTGTFQDDEKLIADLVDKLYAKYKEQAISEIRQDEEEYRRLQQEIAKLENEEVTQQQTDSNGSPQEVQGALDRQQADIARSSGVRNKDDGIPEARPDLLQVRAVTTEESRLTSTPERISPDTPRSATDAQRMKPEEPNRGFPPAARESPRPPAPEHRDIGAHQSPSANVGNGQRGPAPPLSQSTQSIARSPAPSPLNRTLPPPPPYPHHQGYGAIPAQHAFSGQNSPRSPVILPPPPGMMASAHHRTPSDGGRVSVPLQHPQQYPPYPPYNFSQSAWPHQPHPNQPYPQHHSPYANQNFYGPPPPGGNMYPVQPPNQPQYPYYPQPIAAHRQGPMLQPAAQYSQQIQSASAASTPVNNRIARQQRARPSGSSTPWTPKAAMASGRRPTSPVRPDRDVSPLSDPESPSASKMDEREGSRTSTRNPKKSARDLPESTRTTNVKSEKLKSGRTGRPARRKRGGSTTSSAMASESRSQSLASFASEHRTDRVSTNRKVKNEPPSTPIPLPSDNEQQRSSGLRRGRGSTITSQADTIRPTTKRKRDTAHEPSPSPSLPVPRIPRLRPRLQSTDPNLVAVTKNFGRLTGPVVNDVITHRHASLFAKPLTEREAPGYKDLIYRPQDLKSIKTAVGKGSRAANAAIEEITAAEDEPGTPNKSATTSTGGMVQLKKLEDLAPPKGIVNSSQLETEIMRVFANAVMFNPLPANERGLGPRFKMQRVDGRDASVHRQAREGDEEGAKGYSYVEVEEGGIIADTRAMFEDVEKVVDEWRSAEQGLAVDALPRSSAGLGLRGGSISMSDAPGDDSASEEESSRTGAARKRRRVEA